jgi:transcriptional regulator with XRE-family HTH domain
LSTDYDEGKPMPSRPKPPTFGRALTRLRKARGWTSWRLSQEAGLSIQTVRMIEKGSDPRWSNVVKLADALESPTDAFRNPEPTRS